MPSKLWEEALSGHGRRGTACIYALGMNGLSNLDDSPRRTGGELTLSTGSSPSEAVAELWRRLEAEDYTGAAELHTEGFAEYARECALREGTPPVHKPRTADALLKRNPDMPRVVAEWEAAQYRKQPATTGYFGSVQGVEAHLQYRAQLMQQRADARSQWNGQVAGHVISTGRAYVVLDEPLDPAQIAADWAPSFVVLRPSPSGWRVSSDLTAGNTLVHFHIAVDGPEGEKVVLS